MEGNITTNDATNILINWAFATWLFLRLMQFRIRLPSVRNDILPTRIYNWSDTDIIQAVHDGGWDWSIRAPGKRPGHYNTVKQYFHREYPHLNFSNIWRSTLPGNRLQEEVSRFLDIAMPEHDSQQFNHLSQSHPVIRVIEAKQYLSSGGMIIKYNAVKQAYLKLHPEHDIFFSGSTSNRAASERFSAIVQQMSPNSSPAIPSTIDDEPNTDLEIPNFKLLYPYLFGIVPSFDGFYGVGSQTDGYSKVLQPLDHQNSNQITSKISSSSVEALALNPLPSGTDLRYYSYPALVSTIPGLRQASANNLPIIPTSFISNEVDSTIGMVENHWMNPNWSSASLDSNISHIVPPASITLTSSSQQLSDQFSFMTATQPSHDITPFLPLTWASNPLESGSTMATDSSAVPNANPPATGLLSPISLAEREDYLTDTWEDPKKLFREFTD